VLNVSIESNVVLKANPFQKLKARPRQRTAIQDFAISVISIGMKTTPPNANTVRLLSSESIQSRWESTGTMDTSFVLSVVILSRKE
jgi:hypothetical protein